MFKSTKKLGKPGGRGNIGHLEEIKRTINNNLASLQKMWEAGDGISFSDIQALGDAGRNISIRWITRYFWDNPFSATNFHRIKLFWRTGVDVSSGQITELIEIEKDAPISGGSCLTVETDQTLIRSILHPTSATKYLERIQVEVVSSSGGCPDNYRELVLKYKPI